MKSLKAIFELVKELAKKADSEITKQAEKATKKLKDKQEADMANEIKGTVYIEVPSNTTLDVIDGVIHAQVQFGEISREYEIRQSDNAFTEVFFGGLRVASGRLVKGSAPGSFYLERGNFASSDAREAVNAAIKAGLITVGLPSASSNASQSNQQPKIGY